MKYLPWLAGGAALGYGLRRGRRANSPFDLWGSDRTSRSLPSPRYSSLVYHCGSRGPGERFSLDDFGSGEGYATFGKGIYFSSRRSVAERYCKYVDWPELTVAVITKPLLDGKPRGGTGDWNCVKCPPNRFGIGTPCWCPKGVLAAGYAGVRVTETTGSKWFAEIVVYDPSAIQVVKTIDRTTAVDEELRETARTQGDEQASRYPRYRPAPGYAANRRGRRAEFDWDAFGFGPQEPMALSPEGTARRAFEERVGGLSQLISVSGLLHRPIEGLDVAYAVGSGRAAPYFIWTGASTANGAKVIGNRFRGSLIGGKSGRGLHSSQPHLYPRPMWLGYGDGEVIRL